MKMTFIELFNSIIIISVIPVFVTVTVSIEEAKDDK